MTHQEQTKTCPGCGRTLPLSRFSKDSHRTDGRGTYCKECRSKSARIYNARRRAEKLEAEAALPPAEPNPMHYVNRKFKDITPREIFEELRARGYRGTIQIDRAGQTRTITL